MAYKGYEEISGSTFSDIAYSAKRRGISFDLKIEYLWDLYIKQNKKCNLSKLDIHFYRTKKQRNTASLDRIDSTKGYEVGNVQWLHKDVNNMKGRLTQQECIDLCKSIIFADLHRKRPSWEEYFMLMADLVSTRSKDPNTHHGCVIVDSNYRVISCGYNGCIQSIDDSQIPQTRPEKYHYYVHSEQNAIIFAKQDLTGCAAFVTGAPCSSCGKMLLQAGISKIYYGKRTFQNWAEDFKAVEKMCQLKNVPLIRLDI